MKMVLEPIFECGFAPSSYGFRPGRGCKDALREVESLLRGGLCHVVDVDIKGYFDNIPHDRLMQLVERRVADGKVLGLIERFLKSGVMEEGVVYDTAKGSPQGGIISPLLANIYLDPFDWLLEGMGLHAVRYADDIVVLAGSAAEAARALDAIGGWMGEAGLALHPEKTRVVDMASAGSHFDFLGYRFWRSRRGRLSRLVRPKSKRALRARIARKTKRCNSRSMEAIIAGVNTSLRGWFAYFKHAAPHDLAEVDGWVRMRLRSVLRKRDKRKGRGVGSDHLLWPNRYFEDLGLFGLERAREEHASLLRERTAGV